MPAVSVIRLQEQITSLIGRLSRPMDFYRALTDLLEAYGDHAYRAGEKVLGDSLLPSYHLPPLVWKQLEISLAQVSQRYPQRTLDVIPLLWEDEHREPREIAAWMLGHIPVSEANAVLDTLHRLVASDVDLTLLRVLFEKGTLTLRSEGEASLLRWVEICLNHEEIMYRRAGLYVCEILASDPAWENLPAVFRLLQPLVEKPESAWFNDLVIVFQKLAERSPSEVSFFLKQVLSRVDHPMSARLVRKVAAFLPEEYAKSLRVLSRRDPSKSE